LSNIPLQRANLSGNLILKVSAPPESPQSVSFTLRDIKKNTISRVLPQSFHADYPTGEKIHYQITIVCENYRPLNQITSLQIIRKSRYRSIEKSSSLYRLLQSP